MDLLLNCYYYLAQTWTKFGELGVRSWIDPIKGSVNSPTGYTPLMGRGCNPSSPCTRLGQPDGFNRIFIIIREPITSHLERTHLYLSINGLPLPGILLLLFLANIVFSSFVFGFLRLDMGNAYLHGWETMNDRKLWACPECVLLKLVVWHLGHPCACSL